MAELADRVLAYDRVAANRRRTRLLVAFLCVLLVPFLSGLTAWVYPWFEIPVVLALGGEAGLEKYGWRIIVIGLVLATLAVMLIGIGVVLAALWRYGAQLVLRRADARPWPEGFEPRVTRALENLSLAAGVPAPALVFIDAPEPNALAVGRDPDAATVAVTRGLVELLDRREMEGVLAHELSHVANEDTRLNTSLAALVAAVAWPTTLVFRLFRSRWLPVRVFGGFLALVEVQILMFTGAVLLALLGLGRGDMLFDRAFFDEWLGEGGRWLYWWSLHATFAPFYILFGAPLVAFWVRSAVSRQRELLADADAVLLTRDPEGLALALTKIGAARGDLHSAESIAHVFIADPRRAGNLLHWFFPTHPAVDERVELLLQMGSGASRESIAEAWQAGARHRQRREAAEVESKRRRGLRRAPQVPDDSWVNAPPAGAGVPAEGVAAGAGAASPASSGSVPVYTKPDGWSTVLVHLERPAPVRVTGQSYGNFLLVDLPDGRQGWVSRLAPLDALASGRTETETTEVER